MGNKKKNREVMNSEGSSSSGERRGLRDSSPVDTEQDRCDSPLPLPPIDFYFEPTDYNLHCKIQTRCQIQAFKTLMNDNNLKTELEWFEEHPQFQHVFHMDPEPNHMVQGMMLLLLRSVKIEDTLIDQKSVVWFVVNGVPIRYSLREHALLCGFNCNRYPGALKPKKNWKNFKSVLKDSLFPKKGSKKVSVNIYDVKDKLETMESGTHETLQLAILYFLSAVIAGKSKSDGKIDNFLWKMAEDPNKCLEYPWGRMTFESTVEDIYAVVKSWKRSSKKAPCIPGFCIPFEILAFECIPNLKTQFRESAKEPNGECPKMCNTRFASCNKKGWTLNQIYKQLGDTKEIHSILETEYDEQADLVKRVLGDAWFLSQGFDSIQDSWNKHLEAGKTICWKDLYDIDMSSRAQMQNDHEQHEEAPQQGAVDLVQLNKTFTDGFEKMNTAITTLDGRVKLLESGVSDLKREVNDLKSKVKEKQMEHQEEYDQFGLNDDLVGDHHGEASQKVTPPVGDDDDDDGCEKEKDCVDDDEEIDAEKDCVDDDEETEAEKDCVDDDDEETEAEKDFDGDEETEAENECGGNEKEPETEKSVDADIEEEKQEEEADVEEEVHGNEGVQENTKKRVKERTPWRGGRLRPRNDGDTEAVAAKKPKN